MPPLRASRTRAAGIAAALIFLAWSTAVMSEAAAAGNSAQDSTREKPEAVPKIDAATNNKAERKPPRIRMNSVIMGIGRVEGLPANFPELVGRAFEIESSNPENQIHAVSVIPRAKLLSKFAEADLSRLEPGIVESVKGQFGLNVVANCEATTGNYRVWCLFYAGESGQKQRLFSAAGEGADWEDAAVDLAREVFGSKSGETARAPSVSKSLLTEPTARKYRKLLSKSRPADPESLELARLDRLFRSGRVESWMFPGLQEELAGRVVDALAARGVDSVIQEYASWRPHESGNLADAIRSGVERGAKTFAAGDAATVPPGRYLHGCPLRIKTCDEDEDRLASAELGAAVRLQVTEVTRGAYDLCARLSSVCEWPSGTRERSSSDSSLPMTGVSPVQAETFCRWIGARLPSEEEWEAVAGFALRGTGEGAVSLPAEVAREYANSHRVAGSDTFVEVAPVGSFKPLNGFWDLFGNVAEITRTLWPEKVNCEGELRSCRPGQVVTKGGSFLTGDERFRLSARGFTRIASGAPFVGFRCVFLDPPSRQADAE